MSIIDDNKTLKEILIEMCNRIQVNYETIDFKKKGWFSDHEWTLAEQDKFKDWMKSLLEDKKRINDIAKYPTLTKHNKKELVTF